MKRLFSAMVCTILWAMPVLAQSFTPGVFASYEELSAEMDRNMMRADIASTLKRFDGGVTSEGEMIDVQRRFSQLFPNGFTHKAMVRKDEFMNGIWREMRVYWVGTRYLWVSMLIHDRGDTVVAIEFTTNTDYDTVAGQF